MMLARILTALLAAASMGWAGSVAAQEFVFTPGDGSDGPSSLPALSLQQPDGKSYFWMRCPTDLAAGVSFAVFFNTSFPAGTTNVDLVFDGGQRTITGTLGNDGTAQVLIDPRTEGDDLWPVLMSGYAADMKIGSTTIVKLPASSGQAARNFISTCFGSAAADRISRKVAALQNTGQQQSTPLADGQEMSSASALAIGAAALAAVVVANEIDDRFFTEAPTPDAPDGKGPVMDVTIATIKAVDTTFGFGGDEIFLLFSDGTRFPANPGQAQSIDSGETWGPNANVRSSGGVSVDLREWDSFNASDVIDNLTIPAGTSPGRYTATLKGDGAEYIVTYDVSVSGAQVVSNQKQPSQPQPQQPVPQAQSARVWTAHNSGDNITVTDCRDDCEEDIGIIFICRGPGLPAEVSVPWVSTETGQAGAIYPIEIDVDGRSFVYEARLSEYGLVGHVPSIDLYSDDPIIQALQGGTTALVKFQGAQRSIGLRGSRAALDVFTAQCPLGSWASTLEQGRTQVDFDPHWFLSNYADMQGRTTMGLSFGLPETDAITFMASCVPGVGSSQIPVNLSVNYGNYPAGAMAPAYIQTSAGTFQYEAEVFAQSSESAGVRLSLAVTDPVWRAMQTESQIITFGVVGATPTVNSASGAASSIGAFVSACGIPAAQPIVPSSNGVVQPVLPTPTVTQPNLPSNGLVLPTLPNQPNVGVAQPVLPSNGIVQPSLPANTTPQPTPGLGGLVLPTMPVGDNGTSSAVAGTSSFTCEDGSNLQVNLSAAGASSIAAVQRSGVTHALISVPSQIGTKYSNGEATLTVSGATAQFVVAGSAPLLCAQN